MPEYKSCHIETDEFSSRSGLCRWLSTLMVWWLYWVVKLKTSTVRMRGTWWFQDYIKEARTDMGFCTHSKAGLGSLLLRLHIPPHYWRCGKLTGCSNGLSQSQIVAGGVLCQVRSWNDLCRSEITGLTSVAWNCAQLVDDKTDWQAQASCCFNNYLTPPWVHCTCINIPKCTTTIKLHPRGMSSNVLSS